MHEHSWLTMGGEAFDNHGSYAQEGGAHSSYDRHIADGEFGKFTRLLEDVECKLYRG